MPPAFRDPPQIVLRIPAPPSANNLFTNVETGRSYGRSRVKSLKYRDWLREAGWEVKRQAPPFFDKPGVRVLIEIDFSRQRDLDNGIKALLDLLVYVHVLADDSLVDDLHIIRRGEKKHAMVSLWPA